MYAKTKGKTLSKDYYDKKNKESTKPPFTQTIELLELLAKENCVKNYLQLIKLAWNNIQKEINRYWDSFSDEIYLNEDQQGISEDARLQIMAYLIVKSGKAPFIY